MNEYYYYLNENMRIEVEANSFGQAKSKILKIFHKRSFEIEIKDIKKRNEFEFTAQEFII